MSDYRKVLIAMAWLNYYLKIPNQPVFFMPIYGGYFIWKYISKVRRSCE